jgi:uncharacterized membrane protein (GlpM family)
MTVNLTHLVLRFILGGTIVLIATLAADLTKKPIISGVIATFPVLIFSTALALFLTGYTSDFLSRYFLGTIAGLAVCMVFSLFASVFINKIGFEFGLTLSVILWLSLAFLVILFRLKVFL